MKTILISLDGQLAVACRSTVHHTLPQTGHAFSAELRFNLPVESRSVGICNHG